LNHVVPSGTARGHQGAVGIDFDMHEVD